MSERTCRMRVNESELSDIELCNREACATVEMDFEGEAVRVPLCRAHALKMQQDSYYVRFE